MRQGFPFFASRTVTWYLARTFVARSAAVLAGLVIILMALDLLGESGDILAAPGNGQAAIWHYVTLRIPQLIQRFIPFAALLGTLITLVRMNQNSEIISMKAAGISAHQILAPLMLSSVAIAGLNFWFDDRVVARATATLTAWQDAQYGPVSAQRNMVTNIWVRFGDDLIHVDEVTGRGKAAVLHRVTYYDREKDRLIAIATATHGVPAGDRWKLIDVKRFDVASGDTRPLSAVLIAPGLDPSRFTLANVNGDGLSFRALADTVAQLQAAGRPTSALRTQIWHKISGPLSIVLMPLLAGIAGFGLARSGRLFVRVVIGMGLGFLYFVADNFALAMGNIGAYPPLLAAWAPFALFLLIGEAVLIRTEE
ncbi:LPS export ABC transporter permease LptG [Sphingomonas bacterium]|uniref:LPS export ABC transporter permease LptG n=1 Tax=Sphingomonas bacterium TaxID=1895847 RepID=UPI001575F4A0|nr:LPS export ABC transporter permease LptG [Sphingomonas bacterium]